MARQSPDNSEKNQSEQASDDNPGTTAGTSPKPQGKGQAIASLKADHRAVEKLFDRYTSTPDERPQLRRQICQALLLHTRLEEEIFYPACRDLAAAGEAADKQAADKQTGAGQTGRTKAGSDKDARSALDEAQVEHDSATVLIAAILSAHDDDPWLDARVTVLAEQIRHHVNEEEQPDKGIFARAEAGGLDTPDLTRRLAERRRELEAGQQLEPGRPVSLEAVQFTPSPKQKENTMPRSQEMQRERDERGRFTSDDDRHYGSRGGGSNGGGRERDEEGRFTSSGRGGNGRGSSRDDDDDRGGRGNGRGEGRGWYGDSRGHSEAAQRGWDDRGGSRSRDDDYDDRRPRSSRGGYDDDDRGGRNGRDRGHGGWFGDPEGHSEASQRGWDNPDHGRSGWYGDSRGHSEASRRGWDNPDHGPSGWYGDSRGHSEASRRGWDNPDHGRSGWFGDPEGHSEASRRGWDDRGGPRRSTSSRDDDYDDDRGGRGSNGGGHRGGGGSGGRGHGGWSGDPEGHAEAARRGWENRR